jgi:hypothetical protein
MRIERHESHLSADSHASIPLTDFKFKSSSRCPKSHEYTGNVQLLLLCDPTYTRFLNFFATESLAPSTQSAESVAVPPA